MNFQFPQEEDEFSKYHIKDRCAQFGAKHLSKFIKRIEPPIPIPWSDEGIVKYYGSFVILTREQVASIVALCSGNMDVSSAVRNILQEPIEELKDVNNLP